MGQRRIQLNQIDHILHKNPVRFATTANLDATYNNTNVIDGFTYSTLTMNTTGVLVVDGSGAAALGDLILVKDQTNSFENGIYEVIIEGAVGIASVLERHIDSAHIESFPGSEVRVLDGTAQAGQKFFCEETSVSFSSGTITYTGDSGLDSLIGGDGLTKTGNQLDVNVDDVTLEIVGDNLEVKDGGLTFDKFNTNIFDTDLSNGGDANLIVTAETVANYIDNSIAALSSGLSYEGTFDASVGDYTALDNAEQGDFYKVSVAGTIDGVDYQVGDMIIINKNVTGTPVTADIDKIDNTEAPDIVRLNEIQTLTNKTIDADNNTVSNLETDNFKAGAIDEDLSDGTSAAHDTLASAKAVKDYIDSEIVGAINASKSRNITNYVTTARETNVAVTVDTYATGTNQISVYVNGVYQHLAEGAYVETNATTVTFTVIPPNSIVTIIG